MTPHATLIILDTRYHRGMTMLADDALVRRSGLGPAAALFRSLADPARLAIVQHLAVHEQARVVDLTAELGLAQSTVSKHLACLRDCGLVASRPVGRASVYSLTQPALAGVLSAAETVLAATGNAVALCPAYGQGR
jgi:ArsR family transcriptional regulator, cadmium/lead-responsive transcriptional repressor